MAKLEGVKVLDMKYGEILRVEYGGEIYEKVDGPAQANDLIYATTNTLVDVTKNSFYKCIGVDSDGCVVFYDDADDFMTRQPRSFQVFRKISVQPSLADRVKKLESRVDKLEGKIDDGYRLVTDREPRVGDYIKFDEAPCCYLTAGKYYEIEEFDGDDPIIIGDDGDEYDTFGTKFEVYEKVPDENEMKFLRAGRKPGEFKVGDIVRGPEGNPVVDIFEIIEIREGSTHPIRFINRNGKNDGFSINANLTLIAPVEARVDRP